MQRFAKRRRQGWLRSEFASRAGNVGAAATAVADGKGLAAQDELRLILRAEPRENGFASGVTQLLLDEAVEAAGRIGGVPPSQGAGRDREWPPRDGRVAREMEDRGGDGDLL